MAYTTSTLIGNYLQRTITANETAFLVILLPAVKRWIDNKFASNYDTAAASTRYFDGGKPSVDVDPCQTITEVKTVNEDSTLSDSYIYTENTEYIEEPVNETIKTEIRKRSGCFPHGEANVAVTALFTEYDFTNSKVPDDIQVLASALAAGVINTGQVASTGGNVASESLEGHSISYDTSATALDSIANTDPIIKGIIEQRRQLYVD